jgi:hypothetical protein
MPEDPSVLSPAIIEKVRALPSLKDYIAGKAGDLSKYGIPRKQTPVSAAPGSTAPPPIETLPLLERLKREKGL